MWGPDTTLSVNSECQEKIHISNNQQGSAIEIISNLISKYQILANKLLHNHILLNRLITEISMRNKAIGQYVPDTTKLI